MDVQPPADDGVLEQYLYLHYLSDPSGEHIPPSQTLLMTSKDGVTWTKPEVIFPIYRIPDGWKKKALKALPKI